MHSRAAHVTNGTPVNGARTLNGERRRLTLCVRTRAATLNASPNAAGGAHRRNSSGRTSRARPRRARPLSGSTDAERNRSLSQSLGIPSAQGWPCSQRSRPETGGIPDPRRTRRSSRALRRRGPTAGPVFLRTGSERHFTHGRPEPGPTAQGQALLAHGFAVAPIRIRLPLDVGGSELPVVAVRASGVARLLRSINVVPADGIDRGRLALDDRIDGQPQLAIWTAKAGCRRHTHRLRPFAGSAPTAEHPGQRPREAQSSTPH
jgi:hypothetical protein